MMRVILLLFIPLPIIAQDVKSLGINYHTGLEEIRIHVPGLPQDATPLTMVLIPAGTFLMGSPVDEQERYLNEGPQHAVVISHPFYIGKHEVTQAQFEAVMHHNPSYFRIGLNIAVDNISWMECAQFCNRLGESVGRTPVYDESTWSPIPSTNGFRIPTEAEWEYACRAGTTTRFYWGDDPNNSEIKDYAWHTENNNPFGPKEVGLKLPNSWDLFDMSGNVWEWCQNWSESYSSDGQTNPQGPSRGSERVYRGGFMSGHAKQCRSAVRGQASPTLAWGGFGFRIGASNVDVQSHIEDWANDR